MKIPSWTTVTLVSGTVAWVGMIGYNSININPQVALRRVEYFTVFRQLTAHSRVQPVPPPARKPEGPQVDPNPVASIPEPKSQPRAAASRSDSREAKPARRKRDPNRSLRLLSVIGMVGDQLMVDTPDGIMMLRVGDSLQNRGRITQIRRSGKRWVISTESGPIYR